MRARVAGVVRSDGLRMDARDGLSQPERIAIRTAGLGPWEAGS